MVEELEAQAPQIEEGEEGQQERQEEQRAEQRQEANVSVEQIEQRIAQIILSKIAEKLDSIFEKGVVIVINNYYGSPAPSAAQPAVAQPPQQEVAPHPAAASQASEAGEAAQPAAHAQTGHEEHHRRGRRAIVSARGISWVLLKEGLSLEEAQRRLPNFMQGRVAIGIGDDIYFIDEKLWKEATELYPPGSRPTAVELSRQFGLSEREAEMLARAIEGGEVLADEDVLDEFAYIYQERSAEVSGGRENGRRASGGGYGGGYSRGGARGGYSRTGRRRGGW